jgi:hypothetical protein
MFVKHGAFWLALATTALALAAPAQGHELTAKKAKAALKPVLPQLTTQVAPLIAQKLPGATIAKSRVGACEIRKSHRAECVISFTIQGASTGETECAIDALVKFKNKRSKQLQTAIGPALICLFPVPLS